MTPHPYPSIPLHLHHKKLPHIDPIIPPHKFCLCQYCPSITTYSPHVVPNYPNILPLCYLHKSSYKLPFSVLPHNYWKNISEYRSESRNRIFIKNKKKRRLPMSIWEVFNRDLVSISVFGSHEDLVWQKEVSYLLPPPFPPQNPLLI